MKSKLLYKLPVQFKSFFTSGQKRSIKAKKNILASFILKGIVLIFGLIRVPLILDYLDSTQYGIWITTASIITWFSFLDIGLGNGLRNKLSEALAKQDFLLARIYVSTTYAILCIIIIFIFFIFLMINPALNWAKLINAPSELSAKISILAIIIFTSFSIQFVLNLINIVLLADQLPAFTDVLKASVSSIYLIFIFFLIKTTSGSLIFIGIASGLSQIITFTVASLYFYKKKYQYLTPSFRYINFKCSSFAR